MQSGERRCAQTGALLSARLSRELFECFVGRSRRPRETALAFRVGGRWFCPGCGHEMSVSDAHVVCSHCRRHLNEFVHALVEWNPHRAPCAT